MGNMPWTWYKEHGLESKESNVWTINASHKSFDGEKLGEEFEKQSLEMKISKGMEVVMADRLDRGVPRLRLMLEKEGLLRKNNSGQ